MRPLAKSIVEFVKAENGPTAVEYAVISPCMVVVCVLARDQSRRQRQNNVHQRRHEYRHRQLALVD